MKVYLGFVAALIVFIVNPILAYDKYSNYGKYQNSKGDDANNDSTVSIAFRDAGITPEIIPTAPRDILRIRYQIKEPCFGDELRPSDVVLRPTLIYKNEPGVLYTVLFLSLDVPSEVAPVLRPTLIWMVVNIPGSDVSAGYQVQEYVPPLFNLGSGCHRSVILVYAQNDKLDIDDRNLLDYSVEPFLFSLSTFVEKYNIGELIAGNFFRTCFPLINDEFYCHG